MVENAIGDSFFNVSFRPAKFDDEVRGPVGNTFEVEYKPEGEDDWKKMEPKGRGFEIEIIWKRKSEIGHEKLYNSFPEPFQGPKKTDHDLFDE